MLFKKKDNKLKYACYGVKLQHSGMSQEDLESCFEVFEKHFSNNVYSNENLNAISERLGFDVKDYYAFVGYTSSVELEKKISIKTLYRYGGSRMISSEESEKMFIEKINPNLFFSRVDIENLSQGIGCSVWDRNNFNSYTIVEMNFIKQRLTFECVLKPEIIVITK